MSRTRIDAVALLAAILVAGVTFFAPSNLSYLAAAIGLTAVFVLLAFDGEGYRSAFESFAYAAAIGLCLVMPASLLLRLTGMNLDAARELIVWLVALVVFIAIDRARMSGRVEQPASGSFIRPTSGSFITPAPAVPQYSAPAQYAGPAPVPQPAFTSTPPPAPPAPVAPPLQPVPAVPPAPPPVFAEAPPPPLPQFAAPAHAPVQTTPSAASVQPAPTPAPIEIPAPTQISVQSPPVVPVPAGKEAMIYVNLKDEGLNVLRSVRAEHLGRDYYRILEEMPAGETWEFQQGQIVRCQKKRLSSGKALVATEEAPRAR
jgi:hypothetical protein